METISFSVTMNNIPKELLDELMEGDIEVAYALDQEKIVPTNNVILDFNKLTSRIIKELYSMAAAAKRVERVVNKRIIAKI